MSVGRPSMDPTWDNQLSSDGTTPTAPSTPLPTNGELKPLPELGSSAQASGISGNQPASNQTLDARRETLGSEPTPSVQTPDIPLDSSVSRLTSATPVHLPRQETSTALPEATSHLPGYAVALGGVVALLVLAGGLFFATEAGWLSLGIEQLWGLSNRPEAALIEANVALEITENYQMEGELTLTPAEGSPDGPSSVQFRQQLDGPVTQLDARWSVGATSTLLGNRLAGGSSIQTSSIASGADLYIRHDGMTPDAPWIQTSLGELTNFSLAPFDWSALLSELAAGSDGKRLPGKTINGVRTKGYEVTVASGQLFSLISPPLLMRLSDPVTVQVWLGTKDARPYLIQINGSLGIMGSLTGQLVPSAYDELVPIALPSPDQVEIGTLSDWLEREGIVAVDSPSSRDARRRADLDQIAQALGEYYVAQTPPSYPITNGLVHLDRDPVVQELLKPYLAPIPTDSKAPERYYGYQSDGVTFRLTAVAEEAASDVEDLNGFKLMVRTSQ